MNKKQAEELILAMPNARLDYPFGKDTAVYKVPVGEDEKMFALMDEKKTPVNLSLKCDPQLAKLLREKYETVLEGYHLNKRHWNTILLTGQLSDDEVKDLIVHSYNLVIGEAGNTPQFH